MFSRIAVALVLLAAVCAFPQQPPAETLRFAVSGDSRNCGDVVMPAIAKSANAHKVDFYWHLGDFRRFGMVTTDDDGLDEDMRQQYHGQLDPKDYHRDAWGDFLSHQVAPFGLTRVYLGIGNHEIYQASDEASSRVNFTSQFAYWLDAPDLHSQRLADYKNKPGAADALNAYFHWKKGGVDFIYLDNAGAVGFENDQLAWLRLVLDADRTDSQVKSIVVGMHRALPYSWSCGHSMNETEPARISGRKAYDWLVRWNQETRKNVYLLASHSHFLMQNIYDTPYWQNSVHGGVVLPGWLVGTAGAVRYLLPENLPSTILAKTHTYGYLLAEVSAEGKVKFEYQEMTESDVPEEVVARYGKDFIDQCFLSNRSLAPQFADKSCEEH